MLTAGGVNINLQILIETAQKLTNTKSKQQANKHTRPFSWAFNLSPKRAFKVSWSMGRRNKSYGAGQKGRGRGTLGGHEFGHSAWGCMWCPMVL